MPFEPELLAIVPEGSLEKKYHRLFKHLKVKGEWFLLTGEIKDVIKTIKQEFPTEQILIEEYTKQLHIAYPVAAKLKFSTKAGDGQKRCGTCGGVYPIIEFSVDNSRKDGRDKRCKLCKEYYKKLWRIRRYANQEDIEQLKKLELALQERRSFNLLVARG